MLARFDQRPDDPSQRPIHIIVVEDSSPVIKILSYLIKQEPDIYAHYATSFAAAKSIFQQHQGSLFAGIIDLTLPDAPNGEVVDYFLEQCLPSIVLSGSNKHEKFEHLIEKGIVDYVVKESRFSYSYAVNLVTRLYRNQQVKVLIADDSTTARRDPPTRSRAAASVSDCRPAARRPREFDLQRAYASRAKFRPMRICPRPTGRRSQRAHPRRLSN